MGFDFYTVPSNSKQIGVHTIKIIRYGTGTVYFIRFRYANGIDTGYFLYFVDVFEILSLGNGTGARYGIYIEAAHLKKIVSFNFLIPVILIYINQH